MKRFHECAIVKDGNKRVGYYITECAYASDSMNTRWYLINSNSFEDLVKSNQVQYLVYENGTIKCRYTDEEKNYLLRSLNVKNDFIVNTESNYFSMDVQFNAKHVNLSENYSIVACSLGEISSFLGMKIFVFILTGRASILNILYNEILSMYPTLQSQIKYQVGNNVMCLGINKTILEQLLSTCSVGVLVSVASFKSRQSLSNKNSSKLLKMPSNNYADKIYSYFDSLNKGVLTRFNIN